MGFVLGDKDGQIIILNVEVGDMVVGRIIICVSGGLCGKYLNGINGMAGHGLFFHEIMAKSLL